MTSNDALAAAHDDCSHCSGGVSRRNVLRAGALGAAALTMSGVATQLAWAAPSYSGDVLVLLSLRGGFDGLTAVAPVGDANYAALRPTIAVKAAQGIQLDSRFALHPALAPLQPLWSAGKVGVVHAVGTMDRTRSHFAAMEEVERAAPGSSVRSGWLDRALGLRPRGGVFQGARVGHASVGALSGAFPEMSVGSLKDVGLPVAETNAELSRWTTALKAMHAGSGSAMTGPTTTAVNAVAAVRNLPAYKPAATYPAGSSLGEAMADLARVIKSNLGLQAACLDVGDWDLHEDLSGRMAPKLTDLAACLAAFAQDLGTHLGRVTLVTISEFGRRAQENGSGGTDHGHGNAMLLLSGGLSASKVYGRWPGLAAQQLDRGDLAGTTDYRSVIAEVLRQRCGASNADVSAIFPGFAPAAVGAFKAR
jgi:uncharacterized protein (DUF1501 family)